jgi:hypothetical protein
MCPDGEETCELTNASNSQREAEASTKKLCALVERVLLENQDLRRRITGLAREGSLLSTAELMERSEDDAVTIRPSTMESPGGTAPDDTIVAFAFDFDPDLQASLVYSRSAKRAGDKQSIFSTTSTALQSAALSLFSNLSLSQISNISWYALPIYASDLSNSDMYNFGDEGVEQSTRTRNDSSLPTDSSLPAENLLLRLFEARQRRLALQQEAFAGVSSPHLESREDESSAKRLRHRDPLYYDGTSPPLSSPPVLHTRKRPPSPLTQRLGRVRMRQRLSKVAVETDFGHRPAAQSKQLTS